MVCIECRVAAQPTPCIDPMFCVGPCGMTSETCSCTSQYCEPLSVSIPSCATVYLETTYTCGVGNYDPIHGYKSCNNPCWACNLKQDTFTCPGGYTGACAPTSTPTPSGGPTPTPDPGVGWCTIMVSAGSVMTGQPVTVTLQASSKNAGGNTA